MLLKNFEAVKCLQVCHRVSKDDDGKCEGTASSRPVSYLHFPPSPLTLFIATSSSPKTTVFATVLERDFLQLREVVRL